MEDKKSKEAMCEGDHQCGSCQGCDDKGMMGMGHCHHHRPWKIVFRIVVLLFVFWLGMQLGEVRTYIHSGYGMMGGYDPYYMMDGGYGPDSYGPSGMTRAYKVTSQGAQSGTAAVPATAQ